MIPLWRPHPVRVKKSWGAIDMPKCLVAVQGPIQLLVAQAAMGWYYKVKREVEAPQAVLLLYDFLCSPEQEKALVETITRISVNHKWERIVFVSSAEMQKISRQVYSNSMDSLIRKVGAASFDEVFVARDFCGFGSALILNAYSGAKHIAYGDSFGLVGNEEEFRSEKWSLGAIAFGLRGAIRGLLLGRPKRSKFDTAVLSLPIDWSGKYLKGIPLLIPERGYLVELFEDAYKSLPEFAGYCDALAEDWGGGYLFLLSNLAASGVATKQSETELYLEIIRQNAPGGSSILLKDHPRSDGSVLNSVVESLKVEYRIKIIEDQQYSRIPIELWVPLLKKCTVVPIYSTSAINIKFLYAKDVILPLDYSKMQKYFIPGMIPGMAKGDIVIRESLERLSKWDGTTVLWSGQLNDEKDIPVA